MSKLHRSNEDEMIGGVCGGIAETYNMDSSLVRILFVLFALLGGPGILIYIVLWIALPKADFLGGYNNQYNNQGQYNNQNNQYNGQYYNQNNQNNQYNEQQNNQNNNNNQNDQNNNKNNNNNDWNQ